MVLKKNLTRQEIKDRRSSIIKTATKVTKINVGDKRIKDSTRICGICHRPLTTYVAETGDASVLCSHFSCKMSQIASISLCGDIRSCYSNIGLEENT